MRTVLSLTMVIACLGAQTAPKATAADLAPRTPLPEECNPEYFGTAPPWSIQQERPPRKGVWYFTAPLPPGVNFLVPMGDQNCFGRPAPWTPPWFEYCRNRWPSFDPRTGTIETPDGIRMCI